MSTPPSAGWFDDPDQPDQLRYFDGVIWTAHTTARSRFDGQPAVQDNPASSTGPAQQTAPAPVGGGSLGGSVHLTLAPLITRLVAYIVDRIIVGLLTAVTGFWLILRAFDPLRDELEKASAAGDIAAILTLTDRADRSYLLAYLGFSLILALAYNVFFLVRKAATPGKLLLGLRVQSVGRLGPLSMDTAMRRAGFEAVLSAMSQAPVIGLIGLFLAVADSVWPIMDPRRQALHDKVAGTVVVLAPPKQPTGRL